MPILLAMQPTIPMSPTKNSQPPITTTTMDNHIQIFLTKISIAAITIATITLLILFLQTPSTCIDPNHPTTKPHHKFPKSSCDAAHRSQTTLDKKNQRLWSTKFWQNAVVSFTTLFHDLQSESFLSNHTKVLCVSAGPGQEVMALNGLGIADVTAVELVDSPPLVSKADPHNLPFFDDVFDLGFSARFDGALFPERHVGEMERTVRVGGVSVVVVEECGDDEVGGIVKLFRKSEFLLAKNFTLMGTRMTRITMKVNATWSDT